MNSKSLQKTKNSEAAGDNINCELLKYLSEMMKSRFLQFLHVCWEKKAIPRSWENAIILPLFKTCNNSKAISLLERRLQNILKNYITEGLGTITEEILLDEKIGFRKGRSCSDNVFILKQIIEKHTRFNKDTHILLIDYIKVLDRVERDKLWQIVDKINLCILYKH